MGSDPNKINPNSWSFTVGYTLQGWFDTLTMYNNFNKTNFLMN